MPRNLATRASHQPPPVRASPTESGTTTSSSGAPATGGAAAPKVAGDGGSPGPVQGCVACLQTPGINYFNYDGIDESMKQSGFLSIINYTYHTLHNKTALQKQGHVFILWVQLVKVSSNL